MCNWAPGDKVVCVTNLTPMGNIERSVEVGKTYTVLEIEPVIYDNGRVDADDPVVQLVEATWPCRHHRGGYDPALFRKVERKTDKLSLTEWLSQPAGDTDRIDRSAPIAPRKRERA